MRPVNRIAPKMRPGSYDTYQVDAPHSTHYEEIGCEDAECESYLNGWSTFVDESTDIGQRQAHYIRRESGRGFAEARDESGVTVFTFRKGQPCFRTHRKRLDRPENYYKRRGDLRQYIGAPVKYERPDHWVDDFATHQDNLKTQIERG